MINIPLWFAAKQRGYVRDVPNGVEWADIVAWFCGRDPEVQAESHAAPDRGGKLFSSGSPRSGSAGAGVGVITDTVPLLAPEDDEKSGHVASAARLDGVGEGASRGIRIRTKFEIFKASAAVCPLWFIANWTYNLSLSMTSVTSSTVISNTSVLWTFLFSLAALGESFRWTKLLGVGLCIGGNALTALNDAQTGSDASAQASVAGDIICIFSAVMYGAYSVAIRRAVPDEREVSLPLFFGFLGLINMVVLAPIVTALSLTGAESVAGLSSTVLGLIVLKGLVDNVLSDYLWALGMVLTTPTVATIGLSLTVPLAIMSDLLVNALLPTLLSLLAAACVLGGFLAINLSSRPDPTTRGSSEMRSMGAREIDEQAAALVGDDDDSGVGDGRDSDAEL